MTTGKITLEINEKQNNALLALLRTGFWGNSVQEVALRLMDRQLSETIPDVAEKERKTNGR